MRINRKNLEDLIETVVLPFENYILQDERLAQYIQDDDVAKLHNMAVAKLTVQIYSDITLAKEYIQKGATAHKEKLIALPFLKEFYSLYFRLCEEWSEKNVSKNHRFYKNLAEIEDFVYKSFAQEDESKEDFFIFDSQEVDESIEKMHYKDEHKITAQEFFDEGSMDEMDVEDIIESNAELSLVIEKDNDFNLEYCNGIIDSLKSYGSVLEKNSEFRDLGYSFFKLATLLEEKDITLLDEKQSRVLSTILYAIVEDMLSWTNSVLIERVAVDIHYLDASLLSSIIQVEMLFQPKEEDEEDLEFF